MKSEPITMADIAAAVGVHKSTVTRALRHDPRIRSETVQRVLQAAEDLGYVRNPAASAFSEMRWRRGKRVRQVNFGFMGVAASNARLTANPRYLRVLKSAQNLGYELLPLALHRDLSTGTLNRRLKSMNIQGVILDEIGYGPDSLPSFNWEAVNWPCCAWVSLGEGEYSHPGYRVLHNSFMGTMDALREMAAHGYRSLYFARNANLLTWELWREQAAALLVCKEIPSLKVFDAENRPPSAAIVDAVLGSDPETARKVSRKMGGKPWASLRVDQIAKGRQAGMYLDPRAAAVCAVELLDRQYRKGSFGLPEQRQTLMLESKWREGESLPHRSQSAPLPACHASRLPRG